MSETQRLTDRKREAIVQAALVEFRTHGFESTSMDKIAERADVSKRTVYNHFPSKDALFADILARLWDNCRMLIDFPYRKDLPLRDQLLTLLDSKMDMLRDASFLDLARVAIAEAIHSPERGQEMVTRLNERMQGVVNWVRAAQADGRLKDCDPHFLANQMQGLLRTFAFWPQITHGEPPLSEEMKQHVTVTTVDMFLAYYGCEAVRPSI
jgi:TetR/AcrR family transcriptional regulator, regulator of autoinduction and epiphytic fitness